MGALSALSYLEDPTKRRIRPVALGANPLQAIGSPQAIGGDAGGGLIPANLFGGGITRLAAVPSALPVPSTPKLFGNTGDGPAPLPVPQINPRTQADLTEYGRQIATGSGVSQIENPWLRGLARVGDSALTVLAPRVAAAIPGTTIHHQQLLGQQEGLVNSDLSNDQQVQSNQNLSLQPAYKQQSMELAAEKQNNLEFHQQVTLQQQHAHQQQQYVQNLRDHGFAPDETDATGQAVRPLKYDEMSETQRAVHDLKAAQEEQSQATAALNKAKNDPNSAAYQQANARIQVARENASTAQRRLGLQAQQFELRSQGTVNGVAPAGAMIADDGRSVGTAFQQNVRPTGTERSKADMANSAAEQLGDIKSIVAKHPNMFGPGYGQASAFKQWIGSQDPDAQRFVAARTIAGDHLAGTFGGRSEAALSAIDNAIGQFKDNPAAMAAGLDQLTKANTSFQRAGTVHTTGSNAAPRPGLAAGGNGRGGGGDGVSPEGTRVQMQDGSIQVKRHGQWVKE